MNNQDTTPPTPERSERSERSGGVGGVAANLPNPHAKPTSRTFTDAYRLRILIEIDNAAPGTAGLILRREGIYSSHLARWRAWRDAHKTTTPKGATSTLAHWRDRAEKAERKVSQLNLRLEKTQAIIELQKKLASAFDMISADEGRPL